MSWATTKGLRVISGTRQDMMVLKDRIGTRRNKDTVMEDDPVNKWSLTGLVSGLTEC